MPAKSKAQARFFGAAAAGKVKGVPKKVAKEFLRGTKTKRLPEKKKKK